MKLISASLLVHNSLAAKCPNPLFTRCTPYHGANCETKMDVDLTLKQSLAQQYDKHFSHFIDSCVNDETAHLVPGVGSMHVTCGKDYI